MLLYVWCLYGVGNDSKWVRKESAVSLPGLKYVIVIKPNVYYLINELETKGPIFLLCYDTTLAMAL